MRPGGACGRAELVRALARGDADLAEALAGLLGFEAAAEPVPEPGKRAAPGGPGAASKPEPAPAVEPPIQAGPLVEVPFWRLEAYEPLREESSEERRPMSAGMVGWRNPPRDPPVIRPLAPWRELQPRLRAAITESCEGLDIDLEQVIRRLSRGWLLDRLPRERRRRWGPRLQLVIDRSEHLVPYWSDQDQVRGELGRLVAAQDLEQAVFHEGLTVPQLTRGAPESGGYRAPPGGVVLVLGDLGCLTARASREDNPWPALGRRIAAAGARPVALMPCPLARCPAALSRYWHLVPWERPRGGAATTPGTQRERAERLLRLVSPAVRIEPGLLRAVRLRLGAHDADAGTESDVWQHPAVASTHSEAATLDPKRAREFRAGFAAEPIARQRMVLALLRTWRWELPQEIWFEEILNLAPVSREALPSAADLEDARRFFAHVCDPLDPPDDRATDAWIGRVGERATGSLWTDDVVGTALLRLDWTRHRQVPDYRPPVPIDPALVRGPGHATHRRELRQQRCELVLSAARPGASTEAPEASSYLGVLRSGNRLVQIAEIPPGIDANAFWKSGEPPPWADHWGTDEVGHWVMFSVEDAQGNRITQRLRWIEPGTFRMGSPPDEPGRYSDEDPQHQVIISQGYWLFDTACTQALWEAVMGDSPSRFQSPERPVERVSWDKVQAFLKQINERMPGLDLALPSEAQWEHACRAGTQTAIYTGGLDILGANNAPALDPIAWYGGNSGVDFDLGEGEDSSGWSEKQSAHERAGTRPVALKQANPWGLYDMLGNVWEWVQDCWHDNYQGAPDDGSAWEKKGCARRVIRGGSWSSGARDVRAACRGQGRPGGRRSHLGFRCARVHGREPGRAGAEPAGLATGRQAERRTAQGLPSGATLAQLDALSSRGKASGDVQPSASQLRFDAAQTDARCAMPQAPGFLIRTDCEHLTFGRLTKPAWADAIGRDRYGLWTEIALNAGRARPITQRLRWIPPGRFLMGSPESERRALAKEEREREWFDREGPQHPVIISQGYWLFDTACPQALWEGVMGDNPSRFQSPERPVERVSWDEVQAFLKQINERMPGLDLALPSEAQWEHACRAGTQTAIYTGDLEILGESNAPALDPVAWYGGNSGVDFDLGEGADSSGWPEKQYPHERAGTRPVGRKQANPWGLYDMLGNVWEWCRDGMREYRDETAIDPQGPLDAGAERVIRGGSWNYDARDVRAACRARTTPTSATATLASAVPEFSRESGRQ